MELEAVRISSEKLPQSLRRAIVTGQNITEPENRVDVNVVRYHHVSGS